MPHADMRAWLNDVERLGELRTINGAHWNIEIGVLTEYLMRERNQPAVLFDHIQDYPPGYRLLVNDVGSRKRLALTVGLPIDLDERGLMAAWRQKRKAIKLTPPRYVNDGPVMQNVVQGNDIEITKFPAPLWHEHDGGRYLGTGDAIISRDPENGNLNMGTYRVMMLKGNRMFVYISPGKDGHIHREKYFARKEPMPVVAVFGADPVIHMVASWTLPHGLCELDYCGGLRGEPLDVIRGPVTGLPIPAAAEIAVEGFVTLDDRDAEGPFGEWTGYYASGVRDEPVTQIKAVYFRNDPIILGSPPVRPPSGKAYTASILRSAAMQEDMENAGIPGIKGIWMHECGGGKLFIAVSIQQLYPGHARQAGMVAAQCRTAAYMGRYVVVVDEDIDPMNLEDVIWAMSTRSDPAQDIDIVRRSWSSPLDPVISPEQRKQRNFSTSRAIIDATRPFEWRSEFPRVSESSPELRKQVLDKWRSKLA
jgi:4-hydroxy-3-polyprenylbenzoate decarboxylase